MSGPTMRSSRTRAELGRAAARARARPLASGRPDPPRARGRRRRRSPRTRRATSPPPGRARSWGRASRTSSSPRSRCAPSGGWRASAARRCKRRGGSARPARAPACSSPTRSSRARRACSISSHWIGERYVELLLGAVLEEGLDQARRGRRSCTGARRPEARPRRARGRAASLHRGCRCGATWPSRRASE